MRAAVAQPFQGAYVMQAVSEDALNGEARQAFVNVDLLLSVFEELGRPIKTGDTILDFGCGEGRMVYAFRKLGYKAFGADIAPASSEVEELLEQKGLCSRKQQPLRVIPSDLYKIPFNDDNFDFVVSWEVMEHVQDHRQALSEIRRVLKPCGWSLHFFPARYRFLEPHVHVPLGTLIQGQRYLHFWALMGVRTKSQEGLAARDIAQENHEFLRTETRYLSKRRLKELVYSYFGNIDFVERHYWKYNVGRSGWIYKALARAGLRKAVPLVATILSPFGRRALFFFKPPPEHGLTLSCGYFRH